MDFVNDQMFDGCAFRILTVIDQWSRESVSLEANFRLSGRCVGQTLDQAATVRGWPQSITVDNGAEFTSKALDEWAYRRGVKLDYTRPGKPTDNGLIESFNGRLRDECLNVYEFITMHDMREKMRAWQHDCNVHRPHGSLGHLTPSEFVKNAVRLTSEKPPRLQLKTVWKREERQMHHEILYRPVRNSGRSSISMTSHCRSENTTVGMSCTHCINETGFSGNHRQRADMRRFAPKGKFA